MVIAIPFIGDATPPGFAASKTNDQALPSAAKSSRTNCRID